MEAKGRPEWGHPQNGTAGPPGVSVQGDSVVTAGGAVLLQHLGEEVTVREHGGGLVLGLQLAQGGCQVDVGLGELACRRWMALSKAKLFWQVPAWGAAALQLPVETVLLLLELGQGEEGQGGGDERGGEGPTYGLLLPLLDAGLFRGSLRPPARVEPDGMERIVVRMESGDPSVASSTFQNAVYAAAGRDVYTLVDAGVAAAAALSGTARPRAEKATPPALDHFGWCSWDSFYTNVHPAGLQEGLRALRDGGTPAGWLLIDDGWQSTDVDAPFRGAAASHALAGLERQRTSEELSLQAEEMGVLDADLRTAEPLHEAFSQIHGARPRAASRLARLWFRLYAAAQSAVVRAERVAISALKGLLEESSSDSVVLRGVEPLLLGPLRRAVLRFYASASAHSRRLLSVKANAKFRGVDDGPEAGLAGQSDSFGDVVRELKQRCGVRWVFCWHALAGYWSGVMPGAPGVAKYGARIRYPRPLPGTLEVDASMNWVHPAVAGVALPREPEPLHEDLHAYLAGCGVDGVKVDVQATVTMFGHGSGGAVAIGARYHGSLERSLGRHFGDHGCINSMCCDPIDVYHMEASAWARCSEDFYPQLRASHTAHIANATFSALFVGPIATPDFDMFQSSHDTAPLHAALRAISGGPVYVSDHPGQHDFGLLKRLVLPDGSILRCALPARPTADVLFSDVSRDGRTVLKVWSANAVSGVVGAFNVQGSTWVTKKRNYVQHDARPPPLPARIRPRDVPTLPAAERCAVWLDGSRELAVVRWAEGVEVTVPPAGVVLATVSPVAEAGGVAVAPIGLVNMMNAGGAVLSLSLAVAEEEQGGGGERRQVACRMRLRGCGRLVLFASQAPAAALLDGSPAGAVEWDAGRLSLEVPCGESMQHSVVLMF